MRMCMKERDAAMGSRKREREEKSACVCMRLCV